MVKIGDTVRTGQPAPATGRYECLTHRRNGGRLSIGNTKGDPMPPCGTHGAVTWELMHFD
jgi:hypothetical protein